VGEEKPIGRRAFLGLLVAGVIAFVFGRDAFSRLTDSLDTDTANGAAYDPNPTGPADWHLAVEGLVKKRLELSWADFQKLPQTGETCDFRCVDGLRTEARQWTGARLRDVLDRAGLDAKATHVVFHSVGKEFTDSLTVVQTREEDVLLAHTLNGEALTQDHGGPVRLVAPGRVGYKYVKSVTTIEVIAAGPDGYKGYWEKLGYPVDGLLT
jgi:DMSO/TMAO reductase YedYZ molybdopterin-dependent catalytic subunit